MNSGKWLLVIDGGGTKTACTLLQADSGEIYFSATASGSNYQAIGVENTKKVLSFLLQQVKAFLCNETSQEIAVATFAMAGIDSTHDHVTVSGIIEEACAAENLTIQELLVENDAEATLLGVTAGQAGALLIAGTGAIAYAHDGKGKIERVGGWGHRAGDEGSGYWLGQEVIRAIFHMEDGRGEPTILKDAVYSALHIHDVSELNAWLFAPTYTNAQLAKMGSFLADAVVKNDACAIRISTNAAYELVSLACAVLKNNDYDSESFTLYCNGGAIQHNPLIFETFTQAMASKYPKLNITLCKKAPLDYIVDRTQLANQ
ncbi:MAG: BadF/BadG/BcrA/BcrD ATPase family protein [Lysinibacillus sp.]